MRRVIQQQCSSQHHLVYNSIKTLFRSSCLHFVQIFCLLSHRLSTSFADSQHRKINQLEEPLSNTPVPRCITLYWPSSASTRSTTSFLSLYATLIWVNSGRRWMGTTGSHISWWPLMKLTKSSGKSRVDLCRASYVSLGHWL